MLCFTCTLPLRYPSFPLRSGTIGPRWPLKGTITWVLLERPSDCCAFDCVCVNGATEVVPDCAHAAKSNAKPAGTASRTRVFMGRFSPERRGTLNRRPFSKDALQPPGGRLRTDAAASRSPFQFGGCTHHNARCRLGARPPIPPRGLDRCRVDEYTFSRVACRLGAYGLWRPAECPDARWFADVERFVRADIQRGLRGEILAGPMRALRRRIVQIRRFGQSALPREKH